MTNPMKPSLPESAAVLALLVLKRGYGESLLDYNHRQTTLSVGISMFQF